MGTIERNAILFIEPSIYPVYWLCYLSMNELRESFPAMFLLNSEAIFKTYLTQVEIA